MTIDFHTYDYFSNRSANYEKYRPRYPESAINMIFANLDLPLTVADVGAGTGISSRLMAQDGINVLAIEPNIEMTNAAPWHPQVQFLQRTAENIPLPSATVDLVTSFQAFYWFDFNKSLQEFRRVLKPKGRLALVWNFWDNRDLASQEYCRIVLNSSVPQKTATSFKSWIQNLQYQIFWLGWWLPNFTNLRKYEFHFSQQLDLKGCIGLADSQGFTPSEGEGLATLVSKLTNFHNDFADSQGWVTIRYRTYLYLSTC